MNLAGQLKTSASHRLHWLDALRAISSIIVMVGHYFWQALDLPFRDYFDPGGFGVAVFFFISGYVVPMSVRADRDAAAFRFVWSRIFRLYPLYLISMVLGAIVSQTSLVQDLVNATMIQRFVGVPDVIGVYWTLQIEIIFYAIITVTILARRFNQVWLVATLAIAFALAAVLLGFVRFHYQVKSPLAVPIGLAVIFTGNMRSMVVTGQATNRAFRQVALCVAVLLLAAFFLGYNRSWGFDEWPERFVISYAVAFFVFLGFYRLRERRFAILSSLGAISYPIYLIHLPILELAFRWFPSVDRLVLASATVIVVIALSWLLHVTVEKPFVQLGRALLPTGRPILRGRRQALASAPAGDR